MGRILALLALSAEVAACCGCANNHVGGYALPNFAHPGTEATQQARAQDYEPYPENEPGPPVVGGRPREYQDPRAEVLRTTVPHLGEPVFAPAAELQAPQQPICQPQIVTPPAAIYSPTTATQP